MAQHHNPGRKKRKRDISDWGRAGIAGFHPGKNEREQNPAAAQQRVLRVRGERGRRLLLAGRPGTANQEVPRPDSPKLHRIRQRVEDRKINQTSGGHSDRCR